MPIHTIRPDVAAAMPIWERVRDACLGQSAIKAKAERYLPPLPGHKGLSGREAYERYKDQAVFLGATSRTLRGLTGTATWKSPLIELPEPLSGLAVDLAAAVRPCVRELLLTGRVGLLADSPRERLAPYLATRPAGRVINYELDGDGFAWVVLDDSGHARGVKDPYVLEWRQRFLELFMDRGRYGLRVWTLDERGEFAPDDPLFPTRAGRPLDFMPFHILGCEGLDAEVRTPPLAEIADLNIAHYQLDALHKSTLEKSALIQPYVTGYRPEPGHAPLPFGGGHLWDFPNENAKVGMLEPSGAAFEAFEREKTALEERMASMGARLLEPQKRAAETAEALRLRQAAEHLTLSGVVKSVESGLRQIARNAARWVGVDPGACRVELSVDFSNMHASPEEMASWMQQVQAGLMSFERYAWLCNQGEVWLPGSTVGEELDRIREDKRRME